MTRFSSSNNRAAGVGRISCVRSSQLLIFGLLFIFLWFAISLLSGLSSNNNNETTTTTSTSTTTFHANSNINNPPRPTTTKQQQQHEEGTGSSRNLVLHHHHDESSSRIRSSSSSSIRIAYVGNSLLFFNDSPGLIAAMVKAAASEEEEEEEEEETTIQLVDYDSCLTGGASLYTIGTLGCSVRSTSAAAVAGATTSAIARDYDEEAEEGEEFNLDKLLQQQWDYIVIHDQSRVPVSRYTRNLSIKALNETFVKPIYSSGAIPIFLQTAGYREPIRLYERMTKQLHDGYHDYANLLTTEIMAKRKSEEGNDKKRTTTTTAVVAQVAPVGEAFAAIYKENKGLWEQLYIVDGIHPSALGTWLQACVLYITILGREPPLYQKKFWKTPDGRRRTYERLPTKSEAEYLRQVALRVTTTALR